MTVPCLSMRCSVPRLSDPTSVPLGPPISKSTRNRCQSRPSWWSHPLVRMTLPGVPAGSYLDALGGGMVEGGDVSVPARSARVLVAP